MVKDLDYGKNVNSKYIDFDIDPDVPLSDQIPALKENMVQIVYENNYTLDVGWYGGINGAFVVVIVKDYDWDNPIIKEESTDLDGLKTSLEKCIEHANGLPFYEINPEIISGFEEVTRNTMMPIPLEWTNLESKHTYGWTFIEHGSHLQIKDLMIKAKASKQQFGQWTNDQQAADFIAEIAQKRGVGTHIVSLPNDLPRRLFLATGIQDRADMARVIVNPDGSVQTAYPFNSHHPH